MVRFRLFNKRRNVPASIGTLFCLFLAGPLRAQENKTHDRSGSPGNPLTRVFYGSYTSPGIRSLETRGDESLEALIRDGKLRLSEADAIRLALENNVDINVERYAPYFNLWGIDKGRGVLNSSISFRSDVNRTVTPSSSVLQGGETLLNLSTLYDLSIKKPFEKGFDVELSFNAQRFRSSSFFSSLNPSLTPALSLTYTQHLLRDFGGVARGRHIRIARNTYEMSEEDFVSRVTDVLVSVLTTYWDVVYAEEDIRVKEASKKLAETILIQNRLQAEVGTMSALDVVQAEAEVAGRNEELVTAIYNKRIAEDQLKKLISSKLDPGVIVATVEAISKPQAPPAPTSDVGQAIQRALEIRPEIKKLQRDLDNKSIHVGYTRNQLKPTLDLVATYSQNGLGGVRINRDYSQGFIGAPITNIERGGFGDSLNSLFSRKYLGYVLGLSLTLPIGNDEARANNAQAQIDYRQVEEKLRAQRQKIALEVRDAYDRLERDRARTEATEVTVRYSEQKLQGEQEKYSLGATTTRYILEAQRDLQDAQTRLLRAKIDWIKSRIALDKAGGDTFNAYNIEVEDALRIFK